MHYLLTLHYTADYLERRGAYRDRHLAQAWAAQEQGQLLLAGTVGDPPDRGVLVFDCDSTEPIEAFVQADPYYQSGLVARYEIQPWTTVVGKDAKTPVRPQ